MAQNQRRKADDSLLTVLACGATVEAAARQCGVHARTVYRRLLDPEFKRKLQALRTDMVQRTAGTLTAAATEAVRTLLDLQKANQPAAVRLGSAKAIIELGVKMREMAEFEDRLAVLEERFTQDQAQPRRRGA